MKKSAVIIQTLKQKERSQANAAIEQESKSKASWKLGPVYSTKAATPAAISTPKPALALLAAPVMATPVSVAAGLMGAADCVLDGGETLVCIVEGGL